MAEIIFIFKENQTSIECDSNDVINDICNKFAKMIEKDIDEIYFTYNGEKINRELTFIQHANAKDQKKKMMILLVFEKNVINDNNNSAPTPVSNNNQILEMIKKKSEEEIRKKKLNDLRNKLNELNNNINEITKFLDKIKENMELYYETVSSIINGCYFKNI